MITMYYTMQDGGFIRQLSWIEKLKISEKMVVSWELSLIGYVEAHDMLT